MGILGWLVVSSSSEQDEVTCRTIEDDKNGTWEFIAGDEDYQAVLGDQEHTVLNEEPYESRGFFSRLIFGG